jgi:hypothetical protein
MEPGMATAMETSVPANLQKLERSGNLAGRTHAYDASGEITVFRHYYSASTDKRCNCPVQIDRSILSVAEIGGWQTTSTGITVPSNILSKKSRTRLFIATMSTI